MTKHTVINTETFIQRSSLVHNGFYDYSESVYIKSHEKVKIICPVHGMFSQAPHDHLKGNGCPTCASCNKLTTQEFINRAKEVHADKYDYSLVDYKRNRYKVKILCREHGVFEQRPMHHLNGSGCQYCNPRGGFDTQKTGSIYILKSTHLFKIGITNKTPEHRAITINRSSTKDFSVVFSKQMQGVQAQQLEQLLVKWLRESHKQPVEKFDGYTESFYPSSTPLSQIVNKLLEFEKSLM